MRVSMFFTMLVVLIISVSLCLCGCVSGKLCINDMGQFASHSFRFELLNSNNKTWKTKMLSHYHFNPTDESMFRNLIPRKHLREENHELSRVLLYREMKNSGANSFQGDFLKELSLHDVRLDPESKHGQAQQTNLEYLLMLDVDRLVWSFRKTVGLPTPGQPYSGGDSWEDPVVELRGHFVGHYLSATAQMWASTHNDTLKQKMSAVVSTLSACQRKMGTGYLSAFPSDLFDKIEALTDAWAPYYTIHKIMAGLVDQHTLAGNPKALKMVTWMAHYFHNRVQNVIAKYSIEQHWLTLNEESGGMNDVLYRLYTITKNQMHLRLAYLFDKPCFLGLLAVKADDISGFHANTHIPLVVGSQMRYEVTGDTLYKEIGTFFMDIVNSSHSYATGGTSVKEYWSEPKRLASTLESKNEESCTTYNMLKVSRHLFRWTKEMAYADYYEKALTNGVLSIQRGREPGVMLYYLPLVRGSSKALGNDKRWGTPFNAFWCCYGTGIESFSKLGDSIYFEENGKSLGLYIIQYISSSLNWKSGHILLNQKVEPATSWDPHLRVTLSIFPNKEGAGRRSTLHLRIPFWSYSNGAKALLNGQGLSLPNPGNFLPVTRKWSLSDKISLELPISLRTEPIKDDRREYASIQAILYGPYLLAGLSDGDWDVKTGPNASLSDWITPIPNTYNAHLISLSQQGGNSTFILSNSNNSIRMENFPTPGTNAALYATFRLVLKDSDSSPFSQPKDVIGKSVMLEPIDLPGKVVSHLGKEQGFRVSDSYNESGSVFHLVAGLDGKSGTVSIESKNLNGCFVYGGVNYVPGSSVKLSCNSNSSDAKFKQATSFVMGTGLSSYDPISFVAKGVKRNFLLTALLSLRDEFYTVYFNIQP